MFWRKRQPPQIIVCFADLYPETESAVKAHAPDATFIDTSGSNYAYRDALQRYWTGERDLVVIEQDIEITAEVIQTFNSCRENWCIYSYQGPPHLGYLHRCLGCTKFSAKLQRQFPFDGFDLDAMVWNVVDVNIAKFLNKTLNPHVHGNVKHHHSYKEVIDGLPKNLILWTNEMNIDGKSDAICKELQPDGKTFVYYVNPDGTRGAFKREIPPMPKYKHVIEDGRFTERQGRP
jgi:hypothetical protein